jgi:biopolymer transport protein ExbB
MANPLQAFQNDSAASPGSGGFFSILFSGGPIGMIIVIVLLALSMTSAYMVFDHLISIRRRDLLPDGLADLARQALANGDIKAAQQACTDRPSLLSFVLLQGISEIEFGWGAVEKSLEESLAEQSARLFRKLEYLSVIANVAPMVGLLGTVTGMIMAFQKVAATQGMASAPQLAEGIYSALVTTVLGLIIAIPSIGAFAIFRNRIDQYVAEAAYIAQQVFIPLRRRSRQKRETT